MPTKTLPPGTATQDDDALLSRKKAAEYLNLAEHTLAVWACTGRNELPVIKIGRTVRYRLSHLRALVERGTHVPTRRNVGASE